MPSKITMTKEAHTSVLAFHSSVFFFTAQFFLAAQYLFTVRFFFSVQFFFFHSLVFFTVQGVEIGSLLILTQRVVLET